MTGLRTGCLVIFLAVCSGMDFRFRRLPFWFLLAGVLVGTALELLEHGTGPALFWNPFPGALFFLIALAAPKQLGTGDGWMLMAAGALAGWAESLFLLEGGLLLLFPAAFFWAVVRKKREQELPFAPVLLAACLCGLAVS